MGKIKGPRKTRKYPDEYKVKAICLAEQHVDIFY
jgi:hypothetical protein